MKTSTKLKLKLFIIFNYIECINKAFGRETEEYCIHRIRGPYLTICPNLTILFDFQENSKKNWVFKYFFLLKCHNKIYYRISC